MPGVRLSLGQRWWSITAAVFMTGLGPNANAQTGSGSTPPGAVIISRTLMNQMPFSPDTLLDRLVSAPLPALQPSDAASNTAAGALAKARALLSSKSSPTQLAALQRLQATPAQLRVYAGLALVGGKAGPALALLLEADRRASNDAITLIDLAVVLTSMGYATEAYALASAAVPTAARSADIGINLEAAALQARGSARLVQGRWKDAAALLLEARQKDQTLSEAAIDLAYAELKLSQREKAESTLVHGVWRRPVQPGRYDMVPKGIGDPFRDGDDYRMPSATAFDLSAGTPANLPRLPHATSTAGAVRVQEQLGAMGKPLAEEIAAAGALDAAAGARANAHKPSLSETLGFEISSLAPEQLASIVQATDGDRPTLPDPVLQEQAIKLWDARERFQLAISKVGEEEDQRFRSITDNSCATYLNISDNAVAGVDAALIQFESVYRGAIDFGHLRATGIAANIADEDWHQVAVAGIRNERTVAILKLIGDFQVYGVVAAYGGDCVRNQKEHDDAVALERSRMPGACPKSLRASTVKFESPKIAGLGTMAVGVNCEKISVELALAMGPGNPLSWLAQVDFKHGGDVTLIGGIKASTPSGTGLLPTFGGKLGLYVTANANDGSVKDAGVKIEGSVSDKVDVGIGSVVLSEKVVGGNVPFVDIGKGAVDAVTGFSPSGAVEVVQDAVMYWTPGGSGG